MNTRVAHPLLYQINTRVFLYELGRSISTTSPTHATLKDIPDTFLDAIAAKKFNYVWMLGVWQTGKIGPTISKTHPDLQGEYLRTLPDLSQDDICGSPFSIARYTVHRDFGGNDELSELRERLNERGIGLILDFVPNHMALDHFWCKEHPDYLIQGTEEDLTRDPGNWYRYSPDSAPPVEAQPIFAHGRDPFFAGWTDTVQLNYSSIDLQKTMYAELRGVATMCDGVRCDMAMLLLPEVFARTWRGSIPNQEIQCFWRYSLPTLKKEFPKFITLAEVYWDLEWELLSRGFDYAYDKTLYDRLLHPEKVSIQSHYPAASQACSASAHFSAPCEYQHHLVRFLENHDEPRVAGTLHTDNHKAAAIITFLSPGMRFFHMGQFEGKGVRIPVHLRRGPLELEDKELVEWYAELLPIVSECSGEETRWSKLTPTPAWEGNESWRAVIASWISTKENLLLVAVNYSVNRAELYLPIGELPQLITPHDQYLTKEGAPRTHIRFLDIFTGIAYERDYQELLARGLYLDIPAWGHHVFRVTTAEEPSHVVT